LNCKFSKSLSYQAVVVSVIFFMLLNAILPLDSSLQTHANKYPFKLTIALKKSTYDLGEPVNVTWILTNIGEENVTLYNSRDDPLDFVLRDENFLHVFRYRSYYVVAMVLYPFAPIMPGDNLTIIGVWEQIFDQGFVETEPGFWRPRQVPPGTYYLTGVFSSATYNVSLETPVLKIEIGA